MCPQSHLRVLAQAKHPRDILFIKQAFELGYKRIVPLPSQIVPFEYLNSCGTNSPLEEKLQIAGYSSIPARTSVPSGGCAIVIDYHLPRRILKWRCGMAYLKVRSMPLAMKKSLRHPRQALGHLRKLSRAELRSGRLWKWCGVTSDSGSHDGRREEGVVELSEDNS
jgi:hypothetical protein